MDIVLLILSIIGYVILGVIALVFGIIALVILLMCIPVRVRVKFADTLELTIKYLFIKINPIKEPSEEEEKPKEPEPEQEKKDEEKKSPVALEKIKEIYKKRGAIGFLRLIKRLMWLIIKGTYGIIKHVKIKDIDIYYVVSAENAGDCALNFGKVCSIIYPFAETLKKFAKVKKAAVSVDINFEEEKPKVIAEAEISYIPIFAVGNVLKMAVKALKLILSKKENKK